MNTKYRKTALAAAMATIALGLAGAAQAFEFGSNGWTASFDGGLNAFVVSGKTDRLNGADVSLSETRVMNGWNPTNFNAHFTAPKFNDLTVSGNFRYSAGLGSQADSTGGPNMNMQVRIADINIAGGFGSIGIGRSWAIFNSQAVLNDTADGMGVGSLCGYPGSSGGAGTTCGRIGVGYSWTAFAARVEYDTPNMGGFSARIGLMDPANPGGFQTKTPRLEAEGTFANKFDGGAYKFWVGGLHQNLDGVANGPSATMSGVDVGTRIDVAVFGLTGAYTSTKGFGFAGGLHDAGAINKTTGAAAKAKQWYVDGSYRLGGTTFGVSTGQGKQDADVANGFAESKSTLNTVYVHHDLTPQLHLTVEYDQYKNQDASTTLLKYNLVAVGMSYDF
jgi:hypothetical protein